MSIVSVCGTRRWLSGAVLACVCLALVQVSHAGEAVPLRGTVRNAQGRPLPGAIVTVFPASDSLMWISRQSDPSGAFQFALAPGTYRLVVERIDRLRTERRVTVNSDTLPLKIILQAQPLELAPIRVAADRHSLQHGISKFSISQSDMKTQVGGMEDVMRNVQTLPGVSAPSDLHGEFFVRGSSAAANAVYLDGIEIMFPYHILGFNSVFSPGLVQNAEFYNANAPSEYASASGGVLVVKSRGSQPLPASANVGLSWLSGHMHAAVGDAQRSAAFSMRRSYHDKLVQLLGSVPDQQIPTFHEVHLRGRWRPRDGHEVTAGFLMAGDGMSIPSPELQAQNYALIQGEEEGSSDADLRHAALQTRGARLWVENSLRVFSVQHRYQPAPDVQLEMSLGYVPQSFHFNLSGLDRERVAVRSHVATIRQTAQWQGRRQRLRFGWRLYRDVTERRVAANAGLMQLRNSDTSVHLRDQQERYDFHRSRQRGSGMFHASHFFEPRSLPLEIQTGMRFEHDTLTGDTFSDPQFALTWKFESPWRLRLAWSRTHTWRDKFMEIAPSPSGAPLRAEAAYTTTLGVKGQWEAWRLGVTAWRKSQSNLVYEVQPSLFANGAIGKGRGVDGWFEWRSQKGWMHRLQYSWSRTLQRNPVMFRRNVLAGPVLSAPRQPLFENSYWFHPVQDMRHQLSWRLALAKGPWQFGSQVQVQSGRPWTPVTSVMPDHRGQPVGIEGRRNSDRLPAYFRVDARVARTFQRERMRWNLYVEILNLTRARNVYQYRYDPLYEDRLGIMMLPVLPTLGFEAHF